MPKEIILGPILGLESDTDYTVVFLTRESTNKASVKFNENSVEAKK